MTGTNASQTPLRPRSHAYGLVRTILADAVQRRPIAYNPCHIRGAGNTKRARRVQPATLDELAELRRKDIDLENGVVHVRGAVVRVDGQAVVSTPTSEAGPSSGKPTASSAAAAGWSSSDFWTP